MADLDSAVEALIAAALQVPMPMAAYAIPDWSEDDPRWLVGDVRPAWWQLDYGEAVWQEARRRLRQMRADAFQALLDEGRITRPQLASALGVRLRDLDGILSGETSA